MKMKNILMFLAVLFCLPTAAYSQPAQDAGKPSDRQIPARRIPLPSTPSPEFQLLQYMKSYGQSKVLFGTNFPQLALDKCVRQVEELQLPDAIKNKFLYQNARRVFSSSKNSDTVTP